ncbi:hypothetical protein P43SY_010372 [Pythium insidiosum]|uniref:Uncharacterized protein n=1 Tax=Pythium insidiosum TaxID=114742 RepID=A0AAD5Q0X0_PYTIN|nr:hypothetical protein P43SY_010372 [Pythium insidiosum]
MRAVFTTSGAVYACSARKDDAIANSPDDEPLTSRLKIVGDPGPGVEPVSRLAQTFQAISATKLALAPTKLAELPSFNKSPPLADMKDADVGEPDENTPEELEKLRRILEKHQPAFISSGNALPPPARGVICDIEIEPARSSW